MRTMSEEISYLAPRDVKAFTLTKDEVAKVIPRLNQFGIALDSRMIKRMMDNLEGTGASIAMDALANTLTQASIGTPIQFLQNWLPGFVYILTAARKIDDITGLMIAGSFEDEQVVQGIMEQTGFAIPYGDLSNVPYSSWNTNFIQRTIVRFEEGMRVGVLEEARASRMKVNSAEAKREGAALALEIARNDIGFYGYNNGFNNTYGLLNDPQLSAYVAAPNGNWATATFLQIQQDILTAVAKLRTQSGDQIDVEKTPLTMVLPTSVRDFLSTPPVYGAGSVYTWLKENYPNIRIESCPQFQQANGGANVFYLFADQVMDNSTDGGKTIIQVVPTKFRVNGVAKTAKGYEESYANATAGVITKRPFAIVRYTGI